MQKLVLALVQEVEQNLEQAPRATEVEMPFNWLQAYQSDFQKVICRLGWQLIKNHKM